MRMKDQLARTVTVPDCPQRIISLCPSVTETLAALVSRDRIIGRTSYCTRPKDLVPAVAEIGGTKKLNLDAIRALKPDLLLAVREENDEAQIAALAESLPTVILDPTDQKTMLESIHMIGEAVGAPLRAQNLAHDIEAALSQIEKAQGQRALYLIWRKPYMAAGAGTFIGSMIEAAGFTNAAAALQGRYPLLDESTVRTAKPDVILASSEPFPFSTKYLTELQVQFPNCEILFVDGEAFGWHGARTLHVVDTLNATVRSIGAL